MTNLWCSVDAGLKTGVAYWNNGNLLDTETIVYKNSEQYKLELALGHTKFGNLKFAIIEDYVHFYSHRPKSYKVETQIQLCKEIFPNHIIIFSSQWNSGKMTDGLNGTKRFYAKGLFSVEFPNDHETDAALTGNFVWNQHDFYEIEGKKIAFEMLLAFSKAVRKYPTKKNQSIFSWWTKKNKPRTI